MAQMMPDASFGPVLIVTSLPVVDYNCMYYQTLVNIKKTQMK